MILPDRINKSENTEIVPVEITVESLKSKIYTIRGQRVMLASDLAEIYGYSTKAFNQQVKNNIEKFDEDFRFQLTHEETKNLRSNFLTANLNPKSRYEPFVFTEAGIYMLMTVLKGELATRQSKILIRTFKQMKDYIQTTSLLSAPQELIQLSLAVSEHERDIREIKENMITKDDLTKVIESFSLPEKNTDYLIYSGQYFEAKAAYTEIYNLAKRKIYIVDNYIDLRTLLLLKGVGTSLDIIIFSDNIGRNLSLADVSTFQTQYPGINIKFQRTGGKFHDRYIIIDYKCRSEKIYHCGASSKDAGRLVTTITKADNRKLYYPMIDDLLQQPLLRLR